MVKKIRVIVERIQDPLSAGWFLLAVASALILLTVLTYLVIRFFSLPAVKFEDPGSGIIVVDPGHGGVDGGASRNGILEKDINLDIAVKLKSILENKGYKVLLTREQDVSLDSLDHSGLSRHARDLRARVNIINTSGAQLFLSIHVNCISNGSADGSFVFKAGGLSRT
jgi:N-acetylmuramoyl-L-alanine amidase